MVIGLQKIVTNHRMNINGVYHIGAHWGQEYSDYKKIGLSDRDLYFFEPLPDIYAELVKRVGNSNCYDVALSDFNGMADMFTQVDSQGMSSSLLKPVKHLEQYPNIKFEGTKQVSVVTLDEFVNTIPGTENVNFINIDVQGGELNVFKGAVNTLKRIDYIYTEVNIDEVYQGCAKLWELDRFLSDFGFVRFDTDLAGISWGDALYIKILKL